MQSGQPFLPNLEMQIFKNFLTPHGQPVVFWVKLYRVLSLTRINQDLLAILLVQVSKESMTVSQIYACFTKIVKKLKFLKCHTIFDCIHKYTFKVDTLK